MGILVGILSDTKLVRFFKVRSDFLEFPFPDVPNVIDEAISGRCINNSESITLNQRF